MFLVISLVIRTIFYPFQAGCKNNNTIKYIIKARREYYREY